MLGASISIYNTNRSNGPFPLSKRDSALADARDEKEISICILLLTSRTYISALGGDIHVCKVNKGK
jgi:hypothetical protein